MVDGGEHTRPRVSPPAPRRRMLPFPKRFTCGDHGGIGDEVLFLSLAEVTLGSHVCLSQRAFLCTGSHDNTQPTFDLITKPIVIEDGCCVGAQVFVGPGVVLHPNTVCAAGAVVVKSAGPDEVIGENPAGKIKDIGKLGNLKIEK